MSEKRVKWIDIYKGLGIILMVIGHSTGIFNEYIYQFHMAAFFVISGYTTNLDRDSFGHYFYKKVYSLYIPLLSITVFGVVAMAGLYMLNLYSYFYDPAVYPYIGLIETIKRFLISYDNYVWWLGAAWFILVLFQVEILQKIIYRLAESFNRSKLWYSIISISVFVFGYMCVAKGQFRFRMIDLTFIAQGYFWTGQLLKKFAIWERVSNRKFLYYLGIAISLGYLFLIPKLTTDFTVDYPSREFHNIILNYCSGVLGSFLLYCCAKFSEKKFKFWGNILVLLGRNTMGIMVFHFLAYKFIFLMLFFLKIIPAEYLRESLPSAKMESTWLFMTIGAIVISLFIWRVLLKIDVFQVLFGGKRDFWENVWTKIKDYLKNRKEQIYRIIKKGAVIGCCLLIWGSVFSLYVNYFRPINITFPYKGADLISFEEGWLPQEDNEPYRWIRGSGIATIKLGKWDSICISGFVPDNFTNITEVSVYINNNKIFETDLRQSRNWEFSSDIIKNYHMGETIHLEIEYNDIYLPAPDAVDTRELSGLINKIEFK